MSDYNRGALSEPCMRLPYGFGGDWASIELGDGTGYVKLSEYEKVARDNDKLRELAAEAIRLMQADGPDCGLCKHYDECWTGEAMDYSPSGCVICTEARELGVEV